MPTYFAILENLYIVTQFLIALVAFMNEIPIEVLKP